MGYTCCTWIQEMAANQTQTGGYDCNWAEDTPDDLKCQICLSVAKDPQQHGGNKGCGKIFCNSCITVHQSNSQICPNCREQLSLFEDKRSVRHINALELICGNLEDGCKWVGELGSLNAHLNTCDHALLPCENNCTNNGCAVKFYRWYIQQHLANDCPRRQYQCSHCKGMGEHHAMTGTHLKTCPVFIVPCPNDKCRASIPRFKLYAHRSICQYERVPCKYAEVGCKEKPQRIDHKGHEENDQIHLRVTTAKVLDLTQQLTQLSKRLEKLENADELCNLDVEKLG